ncbi:MAG: hypothetical protein HRU20_23460 [Pseudomonadales bacterium]|nr:hypothetical protein [Pseudomonadales bacterium]
MSIEKYQPIVDAYVEAFDKADLSIIEKMFAYDATVEYCRLAIVKAGDHAGAFSQSASYFSAGNEYFEGKAVKILAAVDKLIDTATAYDLRVGSSCECEAIGTVPIDP